MTFDEEIIEYIKLHYGRKSNRAIKTDLGIGTHRFDRITSAMAEDGLIEIKAPKKKIKSKQTDQEFMKLFEARKGSINKFAQEIGVTDQYVRNRVYDIRRKSRKKTSKPKPTYHPIFTNKWVPGFLESAK